MKGSKADIKAQLQRSILLMQGFKPATNDIDVNTGLYFIQNSFPNSKFPIGVTHEFFCNNIEEVSASCAFVSGIISTFIKKEALFIWISSFQSIFPPALQLFGIHPEKIIFLHLKKEKEKLWAMEEALKCDAISFVIGEINELSFTESRRLQLITEKSKVTGFIIRRNPKNLSTASVTRWNIKPARSQFENFNQTLLGTDNFLVENFKVKSIHDGKKNYPDFVSKGMPGIGYPKWEVTLLKVRNGKPGNWKIQWRNKKFELIDQPGLTIPQEQRKIG